MHSRFKRATRVIPEAIRRAAYEQWGRSCWLQLPGCTGIGDTLDHIVPVAAGGKTTVANLRPCCKHCNSARMNRIVNGFGADIHCVIGPPEGGKSTYVAAHKQQSDIVLDYDALARCLAGDEGYSAVRANNGSQALRDATAAAWSGAYNALTRATSPVGVWIIKALPQTDRHPRLLDEWIALGYEVSVCDPGATATVQRAEADGRSSAALPIVRRWYSLHLSQGKIDEARQRRLSALRRYGLAAAAPTTAIEW